MRPTAGCAPDVDRRTLRKGDGSGSLPAPCAKGSWLPGSRCRRRRRQIRMKLSAITFQLPSDLTGEGSRELSCPNLAGPASLDREGRSPARHEAPRFPSPQMVSLLKRMASAGGSALPQFTRASPPATVLAFGGLDRPRLARRARPTPRPIPRASMALPAATSERADRGVVRGRELGHLGLITGSGEGAPGPASCSRVGCSPFSFLSAAVGVLGAKSRRRRPNVESAPGVRRGHGRPEGQARLRRFSRTKFGAQKRCDAKRRLRIAPACCQRSQGAQSHPSPPGAFGAARGGRPGLGAHQAGQMPTRISVRIRIKS